jgi:hypothetical protein
MAYHKAGKRFLRKRRCVGFFQHRTPEIDEIFELKALFEMKSAS